MLNIKAKPKKVAFKRKRDNYARKKIKQLLKYLRSELGSSTIHGLPYVVNTELHWFERIFWTINFVFCAALIFWVLSSEYTRFVEAPTVSSVEMDYFNWNVSYPAIILCPLHKTDEELLLSFLNDTFERTGQDLEDYLFSITSSTLESLNHIRVPEPDILPLINSSDYVKIASAVFRRINNESIISITNWPLSLEPIMTEMGMCHSINSNVAVFDNPSKWSDSDVTYSKNNIELSFHDRDFFVQIMNYADSYKIYTVSPNEVVLSGTPSLTFDDEGFLSFGVQISNTRATKDVRALSLNLRKCRFVDEPDSGRYPVYSYNRCLMECRLRMIKKLCGCVPHFYKPLANEKVCNLAELKCLEEYTREISTLSVTNETSEKFESHDGMPRSSRDCACLGNCENDVYQKDREVFTAQDDMNRLKIVVAAYPKVRIVRDIIFGFDDIFLKGGGIVNLCIGASVISFMELLMTALRIPIYELLQIIKYLYIRKQKAKVLSISKKNK